MGGISPEILAPLCYKLLDLSPQNSALCALILWLFSQWDSNIQAFI